MVLRTLPGIVLTVLAACVTLLCLADESWRFPTDRISVEQWQTYFDEVRSLPFARFLEANNQIGISPVEPGIIYVFTAPRHPAHPAVVKRYLIETSAGISMGRQGHYAGDQGEFEKWWREFDELDRQLRESVGK